MVSFRAFKFRLYAEAQVELKLRQWAGAVRAVYNCALFQREHFGREHKINYFTQAKELTALRAEFDWVRDCPSQVTQQALRDLDAAFSSFFAGRSGFPTPRKKGRNESFRYPGQEVRPPEKINHRWGRVRLPKAGEVRFRQTRPIQGKIKNVTIIHEANGWHIVFACEVPKSDMASGRGLPAVGIDRGIINTVALSTGELWSMPKNDLERRHRKAQQVLAKCRRGSRRHSEAKRRTAALKAKAARCRQHWQHEVTTEIVRRHDTVVIEALKIRNMTRSAKGSVGSPGSQVRQKSGLNRSILAASWYRFELFLSYKLATQGGKLLHVNAAYTSRTCPECGSIHRANRESQAKFECVKCGHKDHADINAARNILKAGTLPASDNRRELLVAV